ncbi:MAG: RNA polymerase factor sigma-54 [Ignavibacteria bacterium]|jgi:RNA polymerase sigma-54 factor|nr:RNA polymerase factor sigma-54 [Ignavibacteria bacterium]
MISTSLVQKTSLRQALTPQQIQYLRLLHLPLVSLEQVVKQEIEINPFLEEDDGTIDELLGTTEDDYAPAPDQAYELPNTRLTYNDDYTPSATEIHDDIHPEDTAVKPLEDGDNYEYYENGWEDDNDFIPNKNTDYDNDFEPFQIKDNSTLYENLFEQLATLHLTDEEQILAMHIIGNIDEDGYLRRSLEEIAAETNSFIADHNFNTQKKQYEKKMRAANRGSNVNPNINPATDYSLEGQALDLLRDTMESHIDIVKDNNILDKQGTRELLFQCRYIDNDDKIFAPISDANAEKLLAIVQGLEPPGIASRNVQECLIAQLKAKPSLTDGQQIAFLILTQAFEDFSKKHFKEIQKRLLITEDQIRDGFEEIKKLNPKPGGDDYISQTNTIIPDFIVKYESEIDDLVITLNDTTVPNLKVSPTYDKLREEAKKNKDFNKETKEWIRDKYESAKFFIQAIKQRNITMLMVMTAIAQRQREFFMNDVRSIKPMIYKDIADDTALDISTVCRIVNDKYVFTSTGTYELKFFFSEALLNDDDEEVSTTVIKDRIKELVATEPKTKPFSDEQLCKLLKDEGYNVARRTIAKYRETLRIPVARMRRELIKSKNESL